MSNFMKDMFIEVREQKEALTQVQVITEMIEEIMQVHRHSQTQPQ